MPGGLAARVREWVVETASVSVRVGKSGGGERRGRGRGRGDEDDGGADGRVVVVAEVGEEGEGEGMRVLRDSGGRGWMLVGKGGGGGGRKGKRGVEVGGVVRVREPMWEVAMGEENWRVCVDWSVE